MNSNAEREKFFTQYGESSVFESCRINYCSIKNRFLINDLDSHLARLQDGSHHCRLAVFDPVELERKISTFLIDKIENFSDLKNYYLRIVNSKQGVELFLLPLVKITEDRVAACTFSAERNNPRIKSTNIAVSIKARSYANCNNCYESLLVDRNGYLGEGAWSNFFWIDNDFNFITAKNNILLGITRKQIVDYLKLNQLSYFEEDSLVARIKENIDSGFICNSLQGIIQLSQIDDLKLANKFNLHDFRENFNNYQNTQLKILC